MHVGGPGSGHYYAYIKPEHDAASSSISGKSGSTWYKVDDDRVTEVSAKAMLKDAFGDSKRRPIGQSTAPYLVFESD